MDEYYKHHNINIARCMYRRKQGENGRKDFGKHNDGWNGIWVKVLGLILYRNNVVGKDTYSIYTKMGGTLPVLKNEIIDFFFARLGTGRTFTVPSRYGCVHILIQL